MKHFLSNRIQAIPESGIRAFFDLVLNSEGIISLGVGEPDFFNLHGPFVMRQYIGLKKAEHRTRQTKGCLSLDKQFVII